MEQHEMKHNQTEQNVGELNKTGENRPNRNKQRTPEQNGRIQKENKQKKKERKMERNYLFFITVDQYPASQLSQDFGVQICSDGGFLIRHSSSST